MTENKLTNNDELELEEKSKSQIKRELLELRHLGKELVELPDKDLDKIPMSDRLREQINKANGMSKGALKRQLGYIGAVIAKEEDFKIIQQELIKIRQLYSGKVNEFHQIEQWRDELIAGDNELLHSLANRFENADRQYLGQLVRNAKKEKKLEQRPKYARNLFKYLKQLVDEEL